jgi:hypothetical protein
MKRTFGVRTPSPAMVVGATALFAALGGTGYGATRLGSHQPAAAVAAHHPKPKPNDNKQDTNLVNRLAPGLSVEFAQNAGSASNAANAANAANATNASHADNSDNATNATHAGTADNATNATNAQHAATAGSAPLPTTLPSHESLTGAYGLIGHASAAGDTAGEAISFEIPLASAPAAHFLAKGSKPTAECPGTPSSPQAAPGNLCIYESVNINMSFQSFEDPITADTGSTVQPFGAEVGALSSAAGNYDDLGSWAVTAP